MLLLGWSLISNIHQPVNNLMSFIYLGQICISWKQVFNFTCCSPLNFRLKDTSHWCSTFTATWKISVTDFQLSLKFFCINSSPISYLLHLIQLLISDYHWLLTSRDSMYIISNFFFVHSITVKFIFPVWIYYFAGQLVTILICVSDMVWKEYTIIGTYICSILHMTSLFWNV